MWQGPLAVPGGDRQSPIDIVVRKSVFDTELKPLVTEYDPQTCQQIWNNGYSFLVEYDDTTDKSSKYPLCPLIFNNYDIMLYICVHVSLMTFFKKIRSVLH